MRLASTIEICETGKEEWVARTRNELRSATDEEIKSHIKDSLNSIKSAAEAFNWSASLEVQELFSEKPLEEAFEICKANKNLYAALLGLARRQFEEHFTTLPLGGVKTRESTRSLSPEVNSALLKDFLSDKPGYSRSPLTKSRVEIRDTQIASLMILYSESLEALKLGSRSTDKNDNSLVSLFSDALCMSNSKIRKIWENRKTTLRRQ